MSKELDFWRFIANKLAQKEVVMLLVVAESDGSSPGRVGYKMAVAADGEIFGSIGGGVMEVNLVEQAKLRIKTGELRDDIIEQVHRRDAADASGMICSGRQTVILRQLNSGHLASVNAIVSCLEEKRAVTVTLVPDNFTVGPTEFATRGGLERLADSTYIYAEDLGPKNSLIIVGGGHCALALSELMSRLDFQIRIFDDRSELNTIEKNEFADEVTIVDSYESIGEHFESGEHTYVVVMTLGYASDAVVIRQLVDRDFRYFGVLGSKAKMATLMKELRAEGLDEQRLAQIRTPIGMPINSRTPEEIAIAIAAEIIAVKNA